MKHFKHLAAYKAPSGPIDLTLGTFDGIHLGHLAIIGQLTHNSTLLTFANHPQTILGQKIAPSIISFSHKQKLLEAAGLSHLVVIPFTKRLSRLTAEQFILKVRQHIPFTRLLLGEGATLGRNREGTPSHLQSLAEKYGFTLTYIAPLTLNDKIVSSSTIRSHIQKGELAQAATLLGRPYSICSTVEKGEGKGAALGFKTANISLSRLCHPPCGVYAIEAKVEGMPFKGVANLGFAPTLKQRGEPLLEAHLFGLTKDLYGKEIEVIFKSYIRAEREFSSLDELKKQIQKDIEANKALSP